MATVENVGRVRLADEGGTEMSNRGRAAVLAGVIAGSFLAAGGPALADTQAEGFVGGFANRPECVQVQNNYARYYRIVLPCYYVGFKDSWEFAYTER
ncbi:hypothetical protein [Amycolatopsis sp. NPDC098790]|uniref:hypothetical protein n=1 Tax=Amycolatopsis sp. NPDC098790 TaxID=3363939 RepID=UPI0038178ED6